MKQHISYLDVDSPENTAPEYSKAVGAAFASVPALVLRTEGDKKKAAHHLEKQAEALLNAAKKIREAI